MTDLPYGRGGSPLQNLILNKKKKTKISAFKITEYMDRGPIYTKKQMSLNGRAEDIYKLAGDISLQIIDWIIKNKPSPYDQSGNATYFKRRKPKDSSMPKQGSLSDIYDHIRMLDAPTYPPAYIDHGKFKIEFSNSQILDDIIKSNVTIKLKNKKK
jgi:methionyl-tRNA formyltransferase